MKQFHLVALSNTTSVDHWGHGACRGATLRRPRQATLALVLRAAQGTPRRVTRGHTSHFSTGHRVAYSLVMRDFFFGFCQLGRGEQRISDFLDVPRQEGKPRFPLLGRSVSVAREVR